MFGRSGLGGVRIEGLRVSEVRPNALLVDMLGARLFALRNLHSGQDLSLVWGSSFNRNKSKAERTLQSLNEWGPGTQDSLIVRLCPRGPGEEQAQHTHTRTNSEVTFASTSTWASRGYLFRSPPSPTYIISIPSNLPAHVSWTNGPHIPLMNRRCMHGKSYGAMVFHTQQGA